MFKRLFPLLSFILIFTWTCGNSKSQYPSPNSIAASKESPKYNTYTFIFYESPFLKEHLYPFFHTLDVNDISTPLFYIFDVKDPELQKKINTILNSFDPETINLIFLQTSPEKLGKTYEIFKKLVRRTVFLFPKTPIINRNPSILVLPENYKPTPFYANDLYYLYNEDFNGLILRFLQKGEVIAQKEQETGEQENLIYLQGTTFADSSIQFFNISNNENISTINSTRSDSNGHFHGLLIKKNTPSLIKVDKGGIKSFYFFGLKNSFLFFELFIPKKQPEIYFYSFFKPIELNNIIINNKALNTAKPLLVYTLNILFKKDLKNGSPLATYEKGVLNVSVNKDSQISYKVSKTAIKLDKQSVIYDFAGEPLNPNEIEKYDFSKQDITIK